METLILKSLYLSWLEAKFKKENRPLHKVAIAREIRKCKSILEKG